MLILNDDQPRGLGYLLIDQRASEIPVSAGRPLFEADTYTCTHCGSVVVMNPDRKRPRYKCRGCDHHICDNCAVLRTAGGPCRTLKQIIDEDFARAERQAGAGTEAVSPLILP